MEGAAVYYNEKNEATLLIYKEYYKNNVFIVYYSNKKLFKAYIDCRDLTNIIPKDCIHILTKLPFSKDEEITIVMWKNLVKQKLESLL